MSLSVLVAPLALFKCVLRLFLQSLALIFSALHGRLADVVLPRSGLV